jgi:hypothetical protein
MPPRTLSLRATLLLLVVSRIASGAEVPHHLRLAKSLAHEPARKSAVAEIASSAERMLPVLLRWTVQPPAGVSRSDLNIGLADAFAQLRAREAIPFLIRNLAMRRWPFMVENWLKTEEAMEERLPAVGALVQIGPEASRELIKRYPLLDPDLRLLALFAISQIADSSARSFLLTAQGYANVELRFAQAGLDRIERGQR